MKRIVFSLILLLLSGCQHQMNEQHNKKVHDAHMKKAAALNAQLGLAYLNKGNIARAKKKLLYALELDSGSAEINASMAYFFEKTGDAAHALSYYKKAMAIAPASGAQLNNFGTFLCRKGDYEQAEKYFMLAVKDVKYVNSAGAYENAGLCQLSAKNDQKALNYFKEALIQDSERLQSLFEAVQIELRFKHYENALALLNSYPELTLKNSQLMQFGLQAAQKTGQHEMETRYQQSLVQLNSIPTIAGATDEYNSLSG